MLFRNQQLLQKSLVNKQFARFAGGDIRHKFGNEITDEQYQVYDQFLSKNTSQTEKKTSLYYLFSEIPIFKQSSWLRFFSDSFSTSKTEQTSAFVRPPKVHENSVFVYQSRGLADTARKARSSEILLVAGGLLTLTQPHFFAAFLIPTYILWGNAYFYEMSRRIATRMDILPHLEMVSVERIGAGGLVYNKLYRIQDLEYVDYEEVKDKENYFWALCGHVLDRKLIFRCKATGEYILFDQSGQWDHEGLNHPLIN